MAESTKGAIVESVVQDRISSCGAEDDRRWWENDRWEYDGENSGDMEWVDQFLRVWAKI